MLFFWKIKDKIGGNFLFLIIMILLFSIIIFFDRAKWLHILSLFWNNFFITDQALIFVYVLIFVFNILFSSEKINHFFTKGNYFHKLTFSVFWWLFSSWPPYLWFPFLKTIKEKNFSEGHIAAFLYARSVKIPLLLLMIQFFWWQFTLVFNSVLFLFSFLIGFLFDILFSKQKILWKK